MSAQQQQAAEAAALAMGAFLTAVAQRELGVTLHTRPSGSGGFIAGSGDLVAGLVPAMHPLVANLADAANMATPHSAPAPPLATNQHANDGNNGGNASASTSSPVSSKLPTGPANGNCGSGDASGSAPRSADAKGPVVGKVGNVDQTSGPADDHLTSKAAIEGNHAGKADTGEASASTSAPFQSSDKRPTDSNAGNISHTSAASASFPAVSNRAMRPTDGDGGNNGSAGQAFASSSARDLLSHGDQTDDTTQRTAAHLGDASANGDATQQRATEVNNGNGSNGGGGTSPSTPAFPLAATTKRAVEDKGSNSGSVKHTSAARNPVEGKCSNVVHASTSASLPTPTGTSTKRTALVDGNDDNAFAATSASSHKRAKVGYNGNGSHSSTMGGNLTNDAFASAHHGDASASELIDHHHVADGARDASASASTSAPPSAHTKRPVVGILLGNVDRASSARNNLGDTAPLLRSPATRLGQHHHHHDDGRPGDQQHHHDDGQARGHGAGHGADRRAPHPSSRASPRRSPSPPSVTALLSSANRGNANSRNANARSAITGPSTGGADPRNGNRNANLRNGNFRNANGVAGLAVAGPSARPIHGYSTRTRGAMAGPLVTPRHPSHPPRGPPPDPFSPYRGSPEPRSHRRSPDASGRPRAQPRVSPSSGKVRPLAQKRPYDDEDDEEEEVAEGSKRGQGVGARAGVADLMSECSLKSGADEVMGMDAEDEVDTKRFLREGIQGRDVGAGRRASHDAGHGGEGSGADGAVGNHGGESGGPRAGGRGGRGLGGRGGRGLGGRGGRGLGGRGGTQDERKVGAGGGDGRRAGAGGYGGVGA